MHHWIHRILKLLKGATGAQDEAQHPEPEEARQDILTVQLPIEPLDTGAPLLCDIDKSKPAKEPTKRSKEPAKRSRKPERRSPKKAADAAKTETAAKRVIKLKGTPLEVASAYIEQNNCAAAVKILDDVIAGDPKNTDALYRRAKVMEALGRTFEAIGDYTALIKAGFVSAEVYSARSRLFFKLGDEAQALRDRQQAKDIYLRTMSELQL